MERKGLWFSNGLGEFVFKLKFIKYFLIALQLLPCAASCREEKQYFSVEPKNQCQGNQKGVDWKEQRAWCELNDALLLDFCADQGLTVHREHRVQAQLQKPGTRTAEAKDQWWTEQELWDFLAQGRDNTMGLCAFSEAAKKDFTFWEGFWQTFRWLR